MIPPEEKAKELINSFKSSKLALICIQEIFDAGYPGYPMQSEYDSWAAWWLEVKNEIEKL